jgi:hypothetical protein
VAAARAEGRPCAGARRPCAHRRSRQGACTSASEPSASFRRSAPCNRASGARAGPLLHPPFARVLRFAASWQGHTVDVSSVWRTSQLLTEALSRRVYARCARSSHERLLFASCAADVSSVWRTGQLLAEAYCRSVQAQALFFSVPFATCSERRKPHSRRQFSLARIASC